MYVIKVAISRKIYRFIYQIYKLEIHMQKIFIFPGQGSQILGMGQDIYNNYNSAKTVFDKVDHVLNRKLTDLMFNGPANELNMTQNTQVALMACSMALLSTIESQTEKSISKLCSFLAGHSVGEYSALCAAESISLEAATTLLDARGRFMQEDCRKQDGAMAACMNISKDELLNITRDLSQHGICSIANDNSDNQIVISGERALIEKAVAIIKDVKGKAIMLNVNGPFHSKLMQESEQKMIQEMTGCEILPAKVPVIMNVSAMPTTSAFEIKDNLQNQITHSVRWREIMSFAQKNELEIVEIGSGSVLSNLARRANYPFNITNVSDLASLDKFLIG